MLVLDPVNHYPAHLQGHAPALMAKENCCYILFLFFFYYDDGGNLKGRLLTPKKKKEKEKSIVTMAAEHRGRWKSWPVSMQKAGTRACGACLNSRG